MNASDMTPRRGRLDVVGLRVIDNPAELRAVEGGFLGLILGAIFVIAGWITTAGLLDTANNPPTTVPTTGGC